MTIAGAPWGSSRSITGEMVVASSDGVVMIAGRGSRNRLASPRGGWETTSLRWRETARCHAPNRFGTVNMEDNINIE